MGARRSLAGAAVICAGTSVLGFLIAALAVSGDRRVDAVVGRTTEAMMALPGLVSALAFASMLGASFVNLLFALISPAAAVRAHVACAAPERALGAVCGERHRLGLDAGG